MISSENLDRLLTEVSCELKKIFGGKLEYLILYGSYARREQTDGSDIDVFALVDLDREQLQKYRRTVSEISGEIDLKYDCLLSVKLQDSETFRRYRTALPYFINVLEEGVRIV